MTNSKVFPIKTAVAIAFCPILFFLLGMVPGLQSFAGLHVSQVTKLGEFGTVTPAPVSHAKPAIAVVPLDGKPPLIAAPPPSGEVAPFLFDPQGALHHFYSALEQTARKEPNAVTTILHYGDSPVTADSITADARADLQARFGDAGHGFLLIAKPWAWYGHRGMDLSGNGWKIEPATQARARDGLHGLGGVSFIGATGASSTVTLSEDESHLEVEYLEQPEGGRLLVMAGDKKLGEVETAGNEKKAGYAEFDLTPGVRDVEIRVSSGTVRLFGYSFSRSQPGVIYSSLGLNGGQVQAVERYFDVNHWTEQLRHQHPDLVVLNYGTNESVFPSYVEKEYPKELREVLQRIKTALPETSILVMSPMDRGQRDASGQIVTPEILPKLVGIQKEVALEMGCSFFNTFEAMGGEGTMGRWYNSQPRLVSADFMHPFPAGAAKVGGLLTSALTKSFDQYETERAIAKKGQ